MIVHSVVTKEHKPKCPGLILRSSGPAKPALVENASLLTKAKRLREELIKWAAKGAKRVPREVRKARLEQCKACEYYRPNGNLGLGECSHRGCGCTRVRLFLATAQCPHNPPKWLKLL